MPQCFYPDFRYSLLWYIAILYLYYPYCTIYLIICHVFYTMF